MVHELGGLYEANQRADRFIQQALVSLAKIEEQLVENNKPLSELQKNSFASLKELTNFVMKRKL